MKELREKIGNVDLTPISRARFRVSIPVVNMRDLTVRLVKKEVSCPACGNKTKFHRYGKKISADGVTRYNVKCLKCGKRFYANAVKKTRVIWES